jgi:hypothetical protein
MIPDFIIYERSPWAVLPPGIHDSTLMEVRDRFVTNEKRSKLYEGMSRGIGALFRSGCLQVFLDGSYVTDKPIPGDYDICWDGRFVNANMLDPVFFDFRNGRQFQKEKYGGEYFPLTLIEGGTGKTFLDFFQTDKQSGNPKGIIRITKP